MGLFQSTGATTGFQMMPNFALLDPPVKIMGGLGEIPILIVEALPTTEPPKYI